MEPGSGSPTTARAKFKFEGSNNDELSFDKNSIITITQQQDGGWWEGTFDGLTGWFPCAYVTVITEKDKLMRSKSVPNATAKEIVGMINRPDYRADVLVDYTKNETEYIESLEKTMKTMLLPVRNSGVISKNDYLILAGNFEDILSFQKVLLDEISNEKNVELPKQKIGGIFMKAAGALRTELSKYAENHPKAVEVINQKTKDLEKIVKENGRDFKELISGLSEPLRHIEKYHTMLQELERIVPENHLDRGDLQRSASVFRETKDLCETLRKQKESQLDFMYVSKVEKIVPFAERGTILYVGVANVEYGTAEPVDRFVALFTRYILFFEVTTAMAYQVKEKYPLTDYTVRKTDSTEFVIEKPGINDIKFTVASSGGELERWLIAFSKAENVKVISTSTNLVRKQSKGAADNNEYALIQKPPHPPPNSESMIKRKSSKNFDESMNASGLKFDHDLEMVLPEGFTLPSSSRNSRNHPENIQLSLFPSYFLSGNSSKRMDKSFKMRKDVARNEEQEFDVLRIIEGYCVDGGGSSDFYNSNESHTPHLIVAEDERILVEEMVGDEVVFQEKSIVDAVYSIKDQLSNLQSEFQKMSKVLESEQKARRRLEHNLPKLSGMTSPDGSSSTPRRNVNSFDS